MREIRLSGSEGGARLIPCPYPYPNQFNCIVPAERSAFEARFGQINLRNAFQIRYLNRVSNRLPISVAVITLNEEENLPRCLESVRDLASEIVVIDSGSTDGTRRIAEQFGAIFETHPWGGFVAQKNIAHRRCGQSWVLGLDADEALSPQLRTEIEALFARPERLDGAAAFSFPRCTLYCGRWIRHGDWYPDRVARLCRRDAARWGGVDPHGRMEIEGRIERLNSDLLHHSTETIDRQISKISSYSNVFMRDALARGRSAGWLDLFGRPVWRFLRTYIFKLGFLDGWQGWHIAWMTAFYTVTRYAKVREGCDRGYRADGKNG